MILKEKLSREYPTAIHFYREGMFWKAYNYSAFSVVRLIKAYMVKKKYVKELREWVVSVGFPDTIMTSSIDRLASLTERVEANEQQVTIYLREGDALNEQLRLAGVAFVDAYTRWFDTIQHDVRPSGTLSFTSPAPAKPAPAICGENEQRVLQALRDFPILRKSPLEVQLFLIELQQALKGGE